MTEQPKAIVLDLSDTGYSIVKCLGHEGVPIIGLHNAPWKPLANHSKYVAKSVLLSDDEGTVASDEETLEALLEIGSALDKKGVIFVASDHFADFCSRHKRVLEQQFVVPNAQNAVTHEIMYKGPMSDLATRIGLPVPTSATLTRESTDIRSQLQSIPLPAIVKPANSLQGYKDKMGIEEDPEQLYELVMRLFDSCSDLLISQYIRGPGHNMREILGFLHSNNEDFVGVVIQKLRQHPYLNLGSGTLETTVAEDDVLRLTTDFAKSVGMKGPIHLEFKKEEGTGKPYFIESNFRCNSGVCISEGAGLNIPYLYYLDAIGALDTAPTDYDIGARWVEEHRDWRLVESEQITFAQLMDGYKNIKAHAVYDPDDPEPFRVKTNRSSLGLMGARVLRHLTTGD